MKYTFKDILDFLFLAKFFSRKNRERESIFDLILLLVISAVLSREKADTLLFFSKLFNLDKKQRE